jgi:tripartite-type tricarboxylate transporter receptor subunit TctC
MAAAAAACVAWASGAMAQAYPVKPIRIVIPYPSGGIDPSLRLMIPKMTEVLGQQPYVENRPGANGLIGADAVARSAPDGYTLLFVAPSTIISGVLLTKDFNLDPLRDFTPITELYGTLKVLVVHPSLPVNSLRELVDYAKRNPNKISYGSGGIGSTFHMDTEQFRQVTGVDMVHVPYKGTGPFTSDLVAGRVEFGIIPLVNVRQHITAGKLKLLAVFEPKRDPAFASTPTIAENYPAMIKIGGWIGLFGPAGMPRPVVQKVYDAALAAMHTPELKEYHDKAGAIITVIPPDDFVVTIKSDYEKMAQLIKSIGLKPE